LNDYVINEPFVAKNIFNIMMGLSTEKPIMLEGPPGVGKTSSI